MAAAAVAKVTPAAASVSSGRTSLHRPAAPTPGRPLIDELGIVQGQTVTPGASRIPTTRFPGTPFLVSTFQHIGGRKTQEDRFTVAPQLDLGGQSCSFFGVFDGTVGDFASENVQKLVIPKLMESSRVYASKAPRSQAEQEHMLEGVVRDMYRGVDEELLNRCAKNSQHYATCTSVTLLVAGDLLVVGHLGDSRVILGKESEGDAGRLVGEQLTMDHKPNLDQEKRRIEQCGGSVEYLRNHNSKPFIRGGDFLPRKALGEQAMQLQYSRAFGAKDLKIFGLSSIPDVKMIRMGSKGYQGVKCVILASDGLWDVISSQQAVTIAQTALLHGENPSETLVRCAFSEAEVHNARADNITVVCIQWD